MIALICLLCAVSALGQVAYGPPVQVDPRSGSRNFSDPLSNPTILPTPVFNAVFSNQAANVGGVFRAAPVINSVSIVPVFTPAFLGNVGAAQSLTAVDNNLINTQIFDSALITITVTNTVDVFTTLTDIFYNKVPVTLTEFVKETVTLPTRVVETTPRDRIVFVTTDPLTISATVSVTDVNSAYQYATEVSIQLYTITHSDYVIRQQVITSTLLQTQIFRPTIVSTRIDTEYDTSTVTQTISNTIVIDATALPSFGQSGQFTFPGQLSGSPQLSLPNQFLVGQGSNSQQFPSGQNPFLINDQVSNSQQFISGQNNFLVGGQISGAQQLPLNQNQFAIGQVFQPQLPAASNQVRTLNQGSQVLPAGGQLGAQSQAFVSSQSGVFNSPQALQFPPLSLLESSPTGQATLSDLFPGVIGDARSGGRPVNPSVTGNVNRNYFAPRPN